MAFDPEKLKKIKEANEKQAEEDKKPGFFKKMLDKVSMPKKEEFGDKDSGGEGSAVGKGVDKTKAKKVSDTFK